MSIPPCCYKNKLKLRGSLRSRRLKRRNDGFILGEHNAQNGGHIYSAYMLSFFLPHDGTQLKV